MQLQAGIDDQGKVSQNCSLPMASNEISRRRKQCRNAAAEQICLPAKKEHLMDIYLTLRGPSFTGFLLETPSPITTNFYTQPSRCDITNAGSFLV